MYEASLAAGLPAGRTLRISVVGQCIEQEETPATDSIPAQTVKICSEWAYEPFQTGGWVAGAWDQETLSRDFTITGPSSGDLHLFLNGKGEIMIHLYENNSVLPTKKKIIVMK